MGSASTIVRPVAHRSHWALGATDTVLAMISAFTVCLCFCMLGDECNDLVVIWSNGLLDPWHGGGFLTPGPASSGNHWVHMRSGAHHVDLRGPHPDDPPDITVRMVQYRFAKPPFVLCHLCSSPSHHHNHYARRINTTNCFAFCRHCAPMRLMNRQHAQKRSG